MIFLVSGSDSIIESVLVSGNVYATQYSIVTVGDDVIRG